MADPAGLRPVFHRSGRQVSALGESVPRELLAAPATEVAPQLLQLILAVAGPLGVLAGRIVEVEAYAGTSDPASHAYRGRTRRNGSMFGPPGTLYVYRSYGIHQCANVVCQPEGVAEAVLLRALEPLAGVDAMRRLRPTARRDRDLASGPGRLCQALGIGPEHDGGDLLDGTGGTWLLSDGTPAPANPAQGPRVGISVATECPWRWWVPGSAHRSGPGGFSGGGDPPDGRSA